MTEADTKRAQPGKRWYTLRTMPQHEKKVAAYLQKKGVELYLPLVTKKRKWSDRIKMIDFPLFPGYLFVRFDWFDGFRTILQHNGALDFIRVEGLPQPMREEDVANLKLLVESALDLQADPDANFPPGQEIEVRYGPLKGVRGVVSRVKNKQRICIHVPLLNQMVSAEVDAMDIEKVI